MFPYHHPLQRSSAARPPGRLNRTLLVVTSLSLLFQLLAAVPPAGAAAGCSSTADCLAKMTLDEKNRSNDPSCP